MARLCTLLLLAAAIAGSSAACKRKKQPDPAPTAATNTLPDRGNADTLPAQKVTLLGEPLAADPAVAAGAPAIEVDGASAPVVAWIEAGTVEMRRWSGGAWAATGPAANAATRRAKGVPVLARETDGGLLLAWIETNAKDLDTLQVARWGDGTWQQLGALGGPGAVADGSVASTAIGPVAVWREGGATVGQYDVHVAVLGAAGWEPLGGGVLRGVPEATAQGPAALATRAGGPVVVGWIERNPAPTTQVRRWDNTARSWEVVPAPPGADAESALSLTMTPDGTLYAALGYTIGLRQLLALPVGAGGWNKIGVPESANGQVTHQALTAGDDGRVVLTYPFGGRYGYWDGRRWLPTSVGVISPSTVVPAAAVAKDGTTYVAWSDSPPGSKEPERVKIFEVK